MNTDETKFYIVETHSYDGESIVEVKTKSGPYATQEEAHEAFKKLADAYKDREDATVDEDNDGIVFYDGQNGIYNALIMEV